MSDNAKLVREKLDQAVQILNEQNIDAWMTFVRETSMTPDPCLDLILGMDMVWQSAFIITKDNQRIALVGAHDAENVKAVEGYNRIVPYVQGVRQDLVNVLVELNPAKLALNYSEDDVAADGLGHGLMMMLQHYLGDAQLTDRFISSETIVSALRGRKSATEVKRIKDSIDKSQAIFDQVGSIIRPGKSELEIAEFAHRLLHMEGLGTAWDSAYCPAVNAGPDSPVGHGGPTAKYKVKPGMLIHMDFGVKHNDYCADLQRMWYVRNGRSEGLPAVIQKAFNASKNKDKDHPAAFDEPGSGNQDVPQTDASFNWTVFCTANGNPCNANSNDVDQLISGGGNSGVVYLDDDIGPLNAGAHTTLFSSLSAFVGQAFPVAIVSDSGDLIGWAYFHITGSVGGSTKKISGYFDDQISKPPFTIVGGHGQGGEFGTYVVHLTN